MRGAWAIAKRDIRAFFVSPVAYVVLTVWLLILGLGFYLLAQWYAGRVTSSATDNPLTAFFGGTTLFYEPLLVFVPVLTMRLVAEERHTGTLEPLLTAPVGEVSVVAGKYLAALVYWVVLWVPTLLYVWIASNYGHVDLGAVASSYVGILGIGLYYMAIGLLMSTVARNQVIAAVLTFLLLCALYLLGILEHVLYGEAAEVFGYLSIWKHMDAFSRGVVDSRYLMYDVSLAAFALFLAVGVLRMRRLS